MGDPAIRPFNEARSRTIATSSNSHGCANDKLMIERRQDATPHSRTQRPFSQLTFRESKRNGPGGTCDHSPTFQRWGTAEEIHQSRRDVRKLLAIPTNSTGQTLGFGEAEWPFAANPRDSNLDHPRPQAASRATSDISPGPTGRRGNSPSLSPQADALDKIQPQPSGLNGRQRPLEPRRGCQDVSPRLFPETA
jgi:hypothetical protein